MIDPTILLLLDEVSRLREVLDRMKLALDAPGDERLRVLALAHFEQLYRRIK